jgi:tRNA (guanine37-N1)-methyltransferase
VASDEDTIASKQKQHQREKEWKSSKYLDEDDDSTWEDHSREQSSTVQDVDIDDLVQNWRQRPEVNPNVSFPTWLIPKMYSQQILQMKQAQPHLASRMEFYQDLHPRLPVIRKYNDTHNLILLRCDDDDEHQDSSDQQQQQQQQQQQHEALLQIQEHDIPITAGPVLDICIPYSQWSVSFLLQQLLPTFVHPIPTAFETVGHIAHFNLKPHHMPYAKLIGQVVLQCLQPTISMVITKDGTVQGPHRTYTIQVLATADGIDPTDTRVTVQESGLSLTFDLATCYWNSRLWQERQELLAHSNIQNNGQWIVDAFCGVGALSLLLAKQYPQSRLWCNDWNPHAIEFLKDNAKRNHVELERIDQVDTFDLIVDIGLQAISQMTSSSISSSKDKEHQHLHDDDDASPPREQPRYLPHHVIMHYPLEAPRFLSALRWWPAHCPDVWMMSSSTTAKSTTNNKIISAAASKRRKLKPAATTEKQQGDFPRFHVYTFCRMPSDSSSSSSSTSMTNNNTLTEDDVAIDIIANELLPCVGATEPRSWRRAELEQLGCDLEVRRVRDVAPGKWVMCVSFSVTSHLLRHMQGDYV